MAARATWPSIGPAAASSRLNTARHRWPFFHSRPMVASCRAQSSSATRAPVPTNSGKKVRIRIGSAPTQPTAILFVPDLGSDRIAIYEIDFEDGKLIPHGHGTCPPGSGPRHFVFHPNGRFAYVINELHISVTAFEYDAKAGTLKAIQTIDSLPEDLRETQSSGAEICIHPGGKLLYVSNRGHDSISAFRIDPETGRLTFIEREPIRGSHPRAFNLDPKGEWLLAAGRDSNTISAFRIDEKSGGLVFSGKIVNSPAPISVEIQPMP